MELKDLYGAILVLALVAILLAVVLIIMGAIGSSTAVSSLGGNMSAGTGTLAVVNNSINGFITAMGSIGTSWAGIIVLVIVASIIIGLVVRSFGAGMQGR